MKTYTIKASYTFTVEVMVRANNKKRAKEIVENDFGAISPTYHSSNDTDEETKDDEGIINWDGEVHPGKNKIG